MSVPMGICMTILSLCPQMMRIIIPLILGRKQRGGCVLKAKPSNRFKKNYNLMEKRGYDMSLIDDVIKTLLEENPLPPI